MSLATKPELSKTMNVTLQFPIESGEPPAHFENNTSLPGICPGGFRLDASPSSTLGALQMHVVSALKAGIQNGMSPILTPHPHIVITWSEGVQYASPVTPHIIETYLKKHAFLVRGRVILAEGIVDKEARTETFSVGAQEFCLKDVIWLIAGWPVVLIILKETNEV